MKKNNPVKSSKSCLKKKNNNPAKKCFQIRIVAVQGDILTIRMAEDKDRERWDESVLSHLDSSPYHPWSWKESVEQAYTG